MLICEYHGIRGYIVGVSRPLCVPCMAFAGILSASGRPLCVPCVLSWLWRVSRVFGTGTGPAGYLVSARWLCGQW
ncbi:hypothetical protein L210DRAFT_3558393 [Boletus edulis BED1]|uniref:Uncharacterized protein n=1 Tax=Boletus edulis BED1 TaxID=1328754 RepID=A0AAD4BAZ2_BOLED|nr:hypothetical protein L210DRAFT_3582607 [Boletus edulis BED1]KAF8432411.1 hypothetical protein L210DRAFT_3558393 [Boletus edulis BED1]